MPEIKKESFNLKPYSPKELREIYGVSYVTFEKWIKPFKNELGKALGRCYTVNQVKMIVEKLGFPEIIEH